MKERVTKKDVQTLLNIIKDKGYWSEDVKEFFSKFSFDAMTRLDKKAKIQMKGAK